MSSVPISKLIVAIFGRSDVDDQVRILIGGRGGDHEHEQENRKRDQGHEKVPHAMACGNGSPVAGERRATKMISPSLRSEIALRARLAIRSSIDHSESARSEPHGDELSAATFNCACGTRTSDDGVVPSTCAHT